MHIKLLDVSSCLWDLVSSLKKKAQAFSHKEVELYRGRWMDTMIKQNNNQLIQSSSDFPQKSIHPKSWSKEEFVQSNFILTFLTQHCYSLGRQFTWPAHTTLLLIWSNSFTDWNAKYKAHNYLGHTHGRISSARYLESILCQWDSSQSSATRCLMCLMCLTAHRAFKMLSKPFEGMHFSWVLLND